MILFSNTPALDIILLFLMMSLIPQYSLDLELAPEFLQIMLGDSNNF